VARTPVYSKSVSNAVTLSAQTNVASCATAIFPLVIDYCHYVLHAYTLSIGYQPQQWTIWCRGGSRGGAIDPLKPKKINFIHHGFVQFGKQHSRCKAICRPLIKLFCHSSFAKYNSSLLQQLSCYEIWLPNITEITPSLNFLVGSAPVWRPEDGATCK